MVAAYCTVFFSQTTSILNSWDDWRWKTLSQGSGTGVYFVDIDEASLARHGRWPWPRVQLAQLLATLLDDYNASVVGVDIIFSEPGDSTGNQLLAGLDKERTIWALAASMGDEPEIQQGVLAPAPACPPGSPWPTVDNGWLGLTGEIAGSHFRAGHIRPSTDRDQTVRTYQPFLANNGKCIPALGLAMYGSLMGLDPDTALTDTKQGWLWGGIPLGLEKSGLMRLIWRTTAIMPVPAHRVLSRDALIPPGAAIVVGSTALGIGDFVTTPSSDRFTGAGVHALALRQWMDRDFVVRPALHSLVLWCVLIPIFIAFWHYSSRSPYTPWLAWVIAATIWVGVSSVAWRWGLLLETKPVALALLWLPMIQGYRLWQERKDRRLIYRQFHAYLPESVLKELIRSKVDPNKLAAQSREITVLFVDLRGFTSLSENMTPEEVVALLNEVMEYLSSLIGLFDGTLDKFMGDGIMAFWGAPVAMDDHADRAVSCARAMLDHLPAFNDKLAAQGYQTISLGIGINSGQVAVGHMGSLNRKNYTAIGDTVNIAARLQQLSGELNQTLLIGADTEKLCRQQHLVQLQDVELKGKKRLVTTYVPALFQAQSLPAAPEDNDHPAESGAQKNGA